ncbi:unnamed protein product, partial [marine sediment metagenome]
MTAQLRFIPDQTDEQQQQPAQAAVQRATSSLRFIPDEPGAREDTISAPPPLAQRFINEANQILTQLSAGQIEGVGADIGDVKEPVSTAQRAARFAGQFVPGAETGGLPIPPIAIKGAAQGLGLAARKARAPISRLAKSARLPQFFERVSSLAGDAKEVVKARVADVFETTAGIPEDATVRLIERPKIFKKEFLGKDISEGNRSKAINGLERAFQTVDDELDEQLRPI